MLPTNAIKSNITGKRVTLASQQADGSYDFAVLIICCHIWNTIFNTAAYRWASLLIYFWCDVGKGPSYQPPKMECFWNFAFSDLNMTRDSFKG